MTEFKAWSTRRLRAADHVQAGHRVWTHHGSTRYLWNERQISAAVDYVELAQDMPR
jgi:hypothetical protein